MKITEQRPMFFPRDMDNGVIGSNSIERILGKIQFCHVLAEKFSIGHILLCESDLGFRKIHTGYMEAFTKLLANGDTGAATSILLVSYLDDVHIGVNTDPAAVPDPDVFVACLQEGIDEIRTCA